MTRSSGRGRINGEARRSDDEQHQRRRREGNDPNNPRANALKRLQRLRMRRKAAFAFASQTQKSMSASASSKMTFSPTHSDFEVNNTIMQFLFEKKLKRSDVKSEGRIIIPKASAEKYMPKLESNFGQHMFMHDLIANRIWMFRFRYWQNNASRVYVLESTSGLVKAHGLQVGDLIMIYKDKENDKYGIRVGKIVDEKMSPKVKTATKSKNCSCSSSITGAKKNKKKKKTAMTNNYEHENDDGPGYKILNPILSSSDSEYARGLHDFPFDLLYNVQISDLPEY